MGTCAFVEGNKGNDQDQSLKLGSSLFQVSKDKRDILLNNLQEIFEYIQGCQLEMWENKDIIYDNHLSKRIKVIAEINRNSDIYFLPSYTPIKKDVDSILSLIFLMLFEENKDTLDMMMVDLDRSIKGVLKCKNTIL